VPPCVPLTEEGSPTALDRSPIISDNNTLDTPISDPNESQHEPEDAADDFPEGDDGFGEFDEFEEGGEDDDDFGDFDDGFQQGEEQAETSFDEPPDQPSIPTPPLGPVSHINTAQAHVCLSDCLSSDA
jgi:hypothetical protein